jgi:hypothetical protein
MESKYHQQVKIYKRNHQYLDFQQLQLISYDQEVFYKDFPLFEHQALNRLFLHLLVLPFQHILAE